MIQIDDGDRQGAENLSQIGLGIEGPIGERRKHDQAQDPAVASAVGYIGPGGPTVTENDGRVFITLKPEGQRNITADQVIARLSIALQQVQGMRLYMQAAQDITIGSRLSKTQYQYTLLDADLGELDTWAPKILAKLKTLNLAPSPIAGDSIFIRRAFLDVAGILPTAEEVETFLNDKSFDKRDKLIDKLLERDEYVDYWAYKWSDLFLISSRRLRPKLFRPGSKCRQGRFPQGQALACSHHLDVALFVFGKADLKQIGCGLRCLVLHSVFTPF